MKATTKQLAQIRAGVKKAHQHQALLIKMLRKPALVDVIMPVITDEVNELAEATTKSLSYRAYLAVFQRDNEKTIGLRAGNPRQFDSKPEPTPKFTQSIRDGFH